MQEIPITVEPHQQSRWGKLKDRIAKKIDQKSAKNEVKASSSVVIPEKKKSEVKKITPVKKSPVKPSGRPIEQVLVGSWNAFKQIPEKQGRGVLNIYDKLRFPKLTTEEQKLKDKTHVFLKKYQKEIGWGVTGVEAAAVTYGVVKGLQYLKERKLQNTRIREQNARQRAGELVTALHNENPLSGAVPAAVEIALTIEQKALQALVDKVNAPDFFAKEFLSPEDMEILDKCYFSLDLRAQIHQGVLEGLLQRMTSLRAEKIDEMPNTLRRYEFNRALVQAAADFNIAHKGLAEKEFLALGGGANGSPSVDILNYARVIRHVFEKRGYYDHGGFDGGRFEDLLKPKRRRRVVN